jgi:hypothetical protein
LREAAQLHEIVCRTSEFPELQLFIHRIMNIITASFNSAVVISPTNWITGHDRYPKVAKPPYNSHQ